MRTTCAVRRIHSVLLYDNCIPYSSHISVALVLFYLRLLCRKGQSVYLWYDKHAAIYFYVKHKKHITLSHSVQMSPRDTICIIRYCNTHIPVGSATITTGHLQLLGYNYLDNNWCHLRFGFIYVKYPCTLVFCKRNTDSFYWKMKAKQVIAKSTGGMARLLQSAMLHVFPYM